MSYHNFRDKNGRFAPKPTFTPNKKKRVKKDKVEVVITVINPTPPPAPTPKVILNGFLLDASGSMAGKEESVVSGFNEINQQGKKDAMATGVVNKSYVAFFGSYYREMPGEIEELVAAPWTVTAGEYALNGKINYSASMGGTALWESTYKMICKLESELRANPGAKVILSIFTDGEENASSFEWRNSTKIKKIIEQKQSEGWVITFIGAGSKEVIERVATSVGIFASNTLSYSNDSVGTKRAFDKMSDSRSAYTANVASGTATTDGFFSED